MKLRYNFFQNIIYLLTAILFIAHQFLEWQNIHIEFLDNYIDVFLLPLILLPLVLLEVRFILKEYNYTLSSIKLISYFLLISIISEIVFSALSSRFTFDWYDILAIGIGTILFHFIYNRPVKSKIIL